MQNLLIPTKIIKSKRKSISLIIDVNGDFIVRAPIKATEQAIFKFINQKSNWVIKKRKEQLQNQTKPIVIEDNNSINILGKDYILKLWEKNRVKVADDIINIPTSSSKEKLIAYLKKLAKTTLTNIVNDFCLKFNLKYQSININSAKTRWGSCSANNKLHFTYKLMLCPIEVVKYIAIHELCHTRVKNHSVKFWDLVESYFTNYKNCEKWLKQNRAIVELV